MAADSLFFQIITIAPALLIAMVLHEVAHGWTARYFGDPTAAELGRLSLNPFRHVDLFFTILLQGILILLQSPVVFGGAKPVPVDPRYFRRPRQNMMWVAAAGPATNLVLGSLSLGGLYAIALLNQSLPTDLPQPWSGVLIWAVYFLVQSVMVNVVLAVFNLLPIPPLDGGRIVVGLLPLKWARRWAQLERFGLLLVVVLIYLKVFDIVILPVLHLVQALINQLFQ